MHQHLKLFDVLACSESESNALKLDFEVFKAAIQRAEWHARRGVDQRRGATLPLYLIVLARREAFNFHDSHTGSDGVCWNN
jgi:hypothetical protein